MIRKASLLVAGALAGATAMSVIYSAGVPASAAGNSTYKELSVFGDVFERVRAQYVTPPDDKKLIEAAINGMLSSLDPHSSFMNAEQAADMRTQTKGEFGGLGIEVTMDKDLVKVVTPIEDTPAAKAGILSGDYISKIDGTEVRGLTLNQAVEKMRGKVGEPIKLEVIRQGADKPLEFTVKRDIIAVQAVKYRVEGDVGYLRIISFTEKTFDDLKKAIDKIQAQVPDDKLRAMCSTFASTRVVCSIRRSTSPTPSSTRAKSSPPVAAIRAKPAASTPPKATSRTASRSSS